MDVTKLKQRVYEARATFPKTLIAKNMDAMGERNPAVILAAMGSYFFDLEPNWGKLLDAANHLEEEKSTWPE